MAQFFNFKEDYYGLTAEEAEKKLSTYGHNTYSKFTKKDKFSISSVIVSPSVLLMLVAGILCIFSLGIPAAVAVLVITAAYCAVSVWFGKTSDKRLKELRDTNKTQVSVIRAGKVEYIEKELLVPEDIVVVREGETVPADAFILESRNLVCDESALTGNVEPSAKYPGGISKSELKPTFVYGGSTVLSGIAICSVSATGVDTRIYQYKGELPERNPYYTGFENFIRKILPFSCAAAAILTLAVLLIQLSVKKDLTFSAFFAITLGICLIPTAISTVIRFYYAKGADELSRSGAVVKSYNDIEKLNSLSVLCIEKEGAISKNRLEVRGIYTPSEELLYKVAALSFEPDSNDPSENALMVKAEFFDKKISDIYEENDFIEKLPDTGDSIRGALWNIGGDRLYCMNGSPEQLLPMCRLSGEALIAAQKRIEDYYESGCTVLAFACVEADDENKLDKTVGFSYTFVGFAAFSAPLHDAASAAVKVCRNAGLRVVMLTETNVGSALSAAKMVGISTEKIVTGKRLREYSDGEGVDFSSEIFAEITPDQKHFIIERLKSGNKTVAAVGTRTADVPALRAADIGITVSSVCTPSVSSAADIIMSDDSFLSVANAISSARQIHRNIKRAVSSMISCCFALILMTIFNLIANNNVMLDPPLAALMTMIFFPLSALAYSGGKADSGRKMPASEFVTNGKFNLRFLAQSAFIGILTAVCAAISYSFMYAPENTILYVTEERSCAFISFMTCTAAFSILRHSAYSPFRAFIKSNLLSKIITPLLVVVPVSLIFIPVVDQAFGLAIIDAFAVVISIFIGLMPAVIFCLIKLIIRLKEKL